MDSFNTHACGLSSGPSQVGFQPVPEPSVRWALLKALCAVWLIVSFQKLFTMKISLVCYISSLPTTVFGFDLRANALRATVGAGCPQARPYALASLWRAGAGGTGKDP